MADDKPLQESFLAQLNEVADVQNQCNQVALHGVPPAFDPIPIAGTAYAPDPLPVTSATATPVVTINPENGNSSSQVEVQEQESPTKDESASAPPQAVTGNVKIQLMEISVDEFKANVEYIQSQFPRMPRRLVCDAFSKANFDCRAAMELLTKEQEKKDQSIVPPLLLAARQQQQQQQQQQQMHQQYQKQQKLAQKSAAKAAAQQSAVAANPQTPQTPPSQRQTASSAASTPLPLPRGGPRRSHSAKEDVGYKRVVSGDKEAERALRQKLKSNVRARVFNHGVKIGRETPVQSRQRGRSSGQDADSSVDASIVDDEDSTMSTPGANAAAAAPPPPPPPSGNVDMDAEEADKSAESAPPEPAEDLVLIDPSEPQSALRLLRDSFPGLPESRLAECLADCQHDVDEAIRVLSGRGAKESKESGGSAKLFFKSGKLAGKVQQAKKLYVKAELSAGAWMSRQTAAAAAAAPPATNLRVYSVPQKRRLTNNARTD